MQCRLLIVLKAGHMNHMTDLLAKRNTAAFTYLVAYLRVKEVLVRLMLHDKMLKSETITSCITHCYIQQSVRQQIAIVNQNCLMRHT